jgi:hypothetical protein
MQDENFEIGDDVLDMLAGVKGTRRKWAILEWAAEFYQRTGKAAHMVDLLAERPRLKYRGLYESPRRLTPVPADSGALAAANVTPPAEGDSLPAAAAEHHRWAAGR